MIQRIECCRPLEDPLNLAIARMPSDPMMLAGLIVRSSRIVFLRVPENTLAS